MRLEYTIMRFGGVNVVGALSLDADSFLHLGGVCFF